jgi:zinc protease
MLRRVGLPFAPRALLLALLLLLATFAARAAEQRLGEHLFLVRDKPGAATHFQMIVGAGCADEAGGECRGLAHYLEHLVLVGRNAEHNEIALRFFPDGSSNGWTSQRATVYVHSVPAREDGPRADLERLFGFYAARLKDFSVSDADAERERNVVRQEHDWRVGSRPFVRLARKLDRLLVADHPSGQWTIGTAEDIQGFTLENARAFHRAWYAINNVDFVVMADIDPVALKDIADRALAGLAPRALPPRASAKQPAVVDGRTDIVEQNSAIRRPGLYFKKLIRMEEGDVQAMGAARTLVTSFLSSRLPGSLFDVIVDKGKLAAGTPSIAFSRVAPKTYTLTIGADAAPDVAPEALLSAISSYVEQLAASGLSAETLARLKTRYAEGQAAADRDPRLTYNRLVGWLASRNRYEQLALFPQRVAGVSPDQVAVVLAALSGPGRTVTGTLVPATDDRR